MVLIPESLGQISQVTLLMKSLMVVSTINGNHAYVDLKPILLGHAQEQLSFELIGTKSKGTEPGHFGSCFSNRQLICSKPDSNIWQINPPSAKISQTSVFKSRKTNICFGHLYEQQPGCLLSVSSDSGKQLQIVGLDLLNHRVIQYIDIEGASHYSVQNWSVGIMQIVKVK